MKYIGVDPSLTGTGLVCIDSEGVIENQDLIKTTASMIIEARLKLINEKVQSFISDSLKDKDILAIVYIEGLSFGAKGNSVMELAGLHYLLRVNFNSRSYIKYDVIPPSNIKKFITGKGNAKKELMLLKVYKRWGVEFTDNNMADAFSLSRMALDTCNYKD